MDKKNWLLFIVGILACCLLAPIKFSAGPVPVSLQTLVLFTVAAIAGKRLGAAIALAYLILGGLGLPVFAGFTAGWEKLFGDSAVTAGFLWGFVPVCYFLGWAIRKTEQTFFHYILQFFRAHILLLICGFFVLYFFQSDVSKLFEALIRLLPGLLIKSLVGGLLSFWIMKNFIQEKR